MAGLTEKEILDKAQDTVEVGVGMEDGVIVQQVNKGHIVKTYAETRKFPKSSTSKTNEK